jgi:hypothetical protein
MLRDIRRSEIHCCSAYYVQGTDAGARKSGRPYVVRVGCRMA